MTSVWTPDHEIAATVNANSTLKTQAFTAFQDQQTFTLTNFAYVPGTGSLLVVYNGALQILTKDFYELTSTTFQTTFKCNAGDSILALGFVGILGAVNTTSLSQYYIVATAGQTILSIPYAYTPGANMSAVYVNGARLYVGKDYVETSDTVITLNVARDAGDEILVVTGTEINSFATPGDSVSYNNYRSITQKASDIISVKDFGAIGDGVTDDTAAIQAAIIAAYGKQLLFPKSIYLCGDLTCAESIEFIGQPGSTLKYKSGGSLALVYISGTSVTFKATGLVFDANGSAQNGTTSTVRFGGIGTASAPATFILRDNKFINGDGKDVWVATDTNVATLENIFVENNQFLGGKEGNAIYGPTYLLISSGTNLQINNNYFDFCGTPSVAGKTGIDFFVSGYTVWPGSQGSISGNTLINCGRSYYGANGLLGAIDGYYGAHNLCINGNIVINPWGRGIQVKTNAYNLAVIGNSVIGLNDLTAGASVDAQIVVNRSTNAQSYGSWNITGNSCVDSGCDGISVNCANSDFTAYASPVLIASNIIKGANRRGIGLYYTKLAAVHTNIVDGGCSSAGIHISVTSTGGTLAIRGNTSSGVSGSDLFIGFTGTEVIDISDNNFLSTTPFSTSGTDSGNIRASNNRTITASVLNAYSEWATCSTAQIDWSSGGSTANASINTCENLSPGTYEITMEGECTAGAGGLALFFSSTVTCSYFRGSGQLYNGTTIVDADTMTGSGSPSASVVSYAGACTHYRCKLFMVVTAAGDLILRGNQYVVNAAVTSVYQGATMSVKRLA